MRVLRLDLLAFGPFTSQSLDFTGGKPGLHIVYGPNEAGKSSTLRALRDALFGIPDRSTDNFVHKHSDLRIGLSLEGRDGTRLAFVRRKGRSNTLLAPDSNQSLEGELLAKWLSGLAREEYESMFGIDYQSLVAGGREITALRGNVGQLLFSAAAGVSRLREVQQALADSAQNLFKAGGSKPPLNVALSEYRKAQKLTRDTLVSSKHYAEQRGEILKVEEQLDKSTRQLKEIGLSQQRWARIRDALPLFGARRQHLETLAGLPPARILRAQFPTECNQVRQELALARERKARELELLTESQQELENLKPPVSILACRQEIRELADALGSHRKAKADLPGLNAKYAASRRDAADILAQIRPDLTIDNIGSLKLAKRQEIELRNLGRAHAALINDTLDSDRRLRQVDDELREVDHQLENLPPAPDLRYLKQAVRDLQSLGDIDGQFQAEERKRQRLHEQIRSEQRRLRFGSDDMLTLEAIVPPSEATISIHESELNAAENRIQQLESFGNELAQNYLQVSEQLAALRGAVGGDLPTEEHLDRARGERRQAWQKIRDVCMPNESSHDGGRAVPPAGRVRELADGFETSVDRADAVADRLRRESQRVAEFSALHARLERLQSEQQHNREELAKAEEHRRKCRIEWGQIWIPLSIAGAQPSEMRAWLQQWQRIVERAAELREISARCDELQRIMEDARRRLNEHLLATNQAPVMESAPLNESLRAVQDLIDSWEIRNTRRAELDRDCRRLRLEHHKAQQEQQAAQVKLAEWQDQWHTALAPLGLPPEATPDQLAEVLALIGELMGKLREADGSNGFLERVQGIQRDEQAFRERVADLCRRCDRPLPADDGTAGAVDLLAQLQIAESAEERLAELQRQQAKLRNELQRHDDQIQANEIRLKTLCLEAGCDQASELDSAWQNAEQTRNVREKLAIIEEALLKLAGGHSLDGFEQESLSIDADQIPDELNRLGEQLRSTQQVNGQQHEKLGELRQQFKTIDRGTQAIDANALVQLQLTRIDRFASEYVRTRLAAVILQRAIDAFNERNQGPMLRRAGEYFCRLTAGSFSGLRIDYNDHDEPVVVGIRSGRDQAIGQDSMSEGSADQLYFSLRLAYLAQWLERHEPLPLVVDDILIKFDDQRARATLELLSDFSRQTQVILFTHHQHLVDLATAHLTAADVSVQTLPLSSGISS